MDSREDAYGHMIWNTFNRLPSLGVIERSDGYVNVDFGTGDYLADYSKWANHEKEAIKYVQGKCLDIGCSGGRVLLYLQKKGRVAIGIDNSPLSIKICKLRGIKNAKVMEIEHLNKFKANSFDSIAMFGYNFGLFGNYKKAKLLLKVLYKITSAKATIVAETRDPYITTNPVHFKYLEANKRQGKMPGQMKIRIRFMQYATKWHDYLYVSKKEMKELLNGTHWKVKKFIDSKNHKEDGRYFAIIEKEIA